MTPAVPTSSHLPQSPPTISKWNPSSCSHQHHSLGQDQPGWKEFRDGAESFLELLLPAVSLLKPGMGRTLTSKGFSVEQDGMLLQPCTWMGWRFRAKRCQMGVEGKLKKRGSNWDSCTAPGTSNKTTDPVFTPPPLLSSLSTKKNQQKKWAREADAGY